MPNTRDRVFDRIIVDHLVRGVTRVAWGSLFYQFDDPGPFVFTLQVGETGDPEADDWQDVGLPVTDGFYAVDDERRDFGTTRQVHYKVKLDTVVGTYYSPPAAVFGILNRHDWNLAREIVRKERLRHRLATVEGWLLKRRRHGTVPANNADPRYQVTDPLTGDILTRNSPAAEVTFGTEFVDGYYAPVPFSLDVDNLATFDAVEPEATGNVNPEALTATARVLLFPSVSYRDVFVAKHSDLRYAIGRIQNPVHIKGVQLIGQVEAKLIPFSDIIYTIPVPAQ